MVCVREEASAFCCHEYFGIHLIASLWSLEESELEPSFSSYSNDPEAPRQKQPLVFLLGC